MKVQDWIHEFDKSSYVMDKMCVYILSQIVGRGIGIVSKNSIWTTKKDDDVTDVDIWFAYLGLGSYLPLTPLDPEDERQLVKVYVPDIYQIRYIQKKVVGSKFPNAYEIPSMKHIELSNVAKW